MINHMQTATVCFLIIKKIAGIMSNRPNLSVAFRQFQYTIVTNVKVPVDLCLRLQHICVHLTGIISDHFNPHDC